MLTKLHTSGGNTLFPTGYKMKSIQNGDVWKGFASNVIPLVLASSTAKGSGSMSNTGSWSVMGANGTALGVNCSASAKTIAVNGTGTSSIDVSATASHIFLPPLYSWNYELLQNSVKSGDIEVWLEK